MDDIELPRKRRKLEVELEGARARENGVSRSDATMGTNSGVPHRPHSHLQFNPSMFERLRKITKDCQKNFGSPKANGDKIQLRKVDSDERQENGGQNASIEEDGTCDVIVSSTGSSPAHSPKPTDLKVLSTPPRLSQKNRVVETEVRTARGSLAERLDQSLEAAFSNGAITDSTSASHETSVEVLDKGNRTAPNDKTDKASLVNGDVDLCAVKNAAFDSLEVKPQESPTLSDVASTVNVPGERQFKFNSTDFREMLKKMIRERMAQIERTILDGSASDAVNERLVALEKENKALKDHAKTLEDSLKQFIAAEKQKDKTTSSRAVQTQDPSWFANSRAKPVTAVPQSSSPTTRSSSIGLNVAVAPTTTTSRVTSTVAPLPGHTIPSSRNEGTIQYGPYSGAKRAQPESIPTLDCRVHVSSSVPTVVPRQSVLSSPRYPSSFAPGPGPRPLGPHSPSIRNESPTYPSPAPHSLAGLRATPPHQAPVPVMRAPRPSPSYNPQTQTQHAGAVRPMVPSSNRPPPITVTVHPQTQTPSNASAVQVSQRLPPPYNYTQSTYNSSVQTGPRIAVAPPLQPARPIATHGGPRPAVYSSSSISQQHVLQQPRSQDQPPSRGPLPVPIRQGPPVQIRSPQHAIVPQRPQAPGVMQYRTGSPRPSLPPQASGVPSSYPNTGIRSSQSTTGVVSTNAASQFSGAHASAVAHTKDPPPKPSVSIAVVSSGIVLSWNMPLEERHAPIASYQLFALQDGGNPESPHQWKKIGVVKALPLPMACTLTQFMPGNKYHFAVRATDESGRLGLFSDPCTITLK